MSYPVHGQVLFTTLVAAGAATLAKCLSFTFKFLFDRQGTVRRAILYMDRSCSLPWWQQGQPH